jgi:hypothetical protein
VTTTSESAVLAKESLEMLLLLLTLSHQERLSSQNSTILLNVSALREMNLMPNVRRKEKSTHNLPSKLLESSSTRDIKHTNLASVNLKTSRTLEAKIATSGSTQWITTAAAATAKPFMVSTETMTERTATAISLASTTRALPTPMKILTEELLSLLKRPSPIFSVTLSIDASPHHSRVALRSENERPAQLL